MAMHETKNEVLGPEDAGRRVSAAEFADAEYVEPWKYERVKGRLAVMAPDGKDHVQSSSPWLERLIVYKVTYPEVVARVVPNAWVRVDGGTDRIGDIGVFLVHDPPALEIPVQAPELMIEIVSPGRKSRHRDYVEKRADYHKIGIREYVIADRFQRRVTVLTHTLEGYDERILGPGDIYTSPLLPGLALPLAEVLSP